MIVKVKSIELTLVTEQCLLSIIYNFRRGNHLQESDWERMEKLRHAAEDLRKVDQISKEGGGGLGQADQENPGDGADQAEKAHLDLSSSAAGELSSGSASKHLQQIK